MSITELCDCEIEKLEAMSFADLEDYFRPMWAITRPVRSIAQVNSEATASTRVNKRKPSVAIPQLNDAQKMFLEQMGITIGKK